MKKILLTLSAAALVLASCAKIETVKVDENRAIEFSSFVGNNTKAVEELTTGKLSTFYVFAEYGDSESSYGNTVFDNEPNSVDHYWVGGKYYSFGAYANGNDGQISTGEVEFDAARGILTFNDYEPNDAKDLVAAVAKVQSTADGANNPAVDLNFKHLLSQVKFTFNTTDADAYTIAISDLEIVGAISKAKGTYNGDINWTSVETKGYVYEDISDVADKANGYSAFVNRLVIPQGNTQNLKVTFDATVSGAGLEEKTASFEATLSVQDSNTWVAGYRYNYTATINADKIDTNLTNKIEFSVTVNDWSDEDNIITNPTVPQP